MKFAAAIIATVAANRYENMNEDDLLVNSSPPFHLPSPARPEVMPMPPSPRPLPSRTSRKLLPRERHQAPPEGRRCQRHGQEMSNTPKLTTQMNQMHKEMSNTPKLTTQMNQ